METRIAQMERALGQKQMNMDYLEKMIDLTREEYNIDIRKTRIPHGLVVLRARTRTEF